MCPSWRAIESAPAGCAPAADAAPPEFFCAAIFAYADERRAASRDAVGRMDIMTSDIVRSSSRRLVSEAVGTALLLAAVVGSGVMGERLSDGNIAIAGELVGVALADATLGLMSVIWGCARSRPGAVPFAVGASGATILFRWLVPSLPDVAERVVVPHEPDRLSKELRHG